MAVKSNKIPLAERMRPKTLKGFYGQEHLVGKGKILSRFIESDQLISIIFWGPPGSGKTTLATILASHFNYKCLFFSAVVSGTKVIKEAMLKAEEQRKEKGRPTIIFIDEIHRFNKAQQGAFLPYVERGDIILFGSTTENPSFEVISPLLSRTKILILKPLSKSTLIRIIENALNDKKSGLGELGLKLDKKAVDMIIDYTGGDSRKVLNTLEIAASLSKDSKISLEIIEEALQKKMPLYDKKGEEHFNLISALHKCLRNSDVDSSLYWLARMITSGEDPLYILRRLVRFASEDIGLADPKALRITLEAKEAFDFIGPPEGELAIAQAVIYLASAPKSNKIYEAWNKVIKDAKANPYEEVPLQLRNAPTGLMKDIGYGKDYQYAHDFKNLTSNMQTMPKRLKNRKYYEPGNLGFEKDIKKRIDWWKKMRVS